MNYSVTNPRTGRTLFQAPLDSLTQILNLTPKQVEDLVHSTIVLEQHWEFTLPSSSAIWPGQPLYIQRMPVELPKVLAERRRAPFIRRQAE